MNNFLKNISKVLRYSSDTIENLLEQFQNNIRARYPQPKDANPSSDLNTLQRLVLADALTDRYGEDDKQVKRLRDLSNHVIVHDGKVKTVKQVRHQHLARLNEIDNVFNSLGFPITARWPFVEPLGNGLYHITRSDNYDYDPVLAHAADKNKVIADMMEVQMPNEHKEHPLVKQALNNLRAQKDEEEPNLLDD